MTISIKDTPSPIMLTLGVPPSDAAKPSRSLAAPLRDDLPPLFEGPPCELPFPERDIRKTSCRIGVGL